MFAKLKAFYLEMCEMGLRIPFAYDSATKAPSITLLFAYVTFVLMLGSVLALHFFKQLLEATIVSIFIWILAVVFYRLRELDKINLNLKTGSIEIEDIEDSKEKDNK